MRKRNQTIAIVLLVALLFSLSGLSVSGQERITRFLSIWAQNDVLIGDDLAVNDDAAVGGALAVTGATTLTGAVTLTANTLTLKDGSKLDTESGTNEGMVFSLTFPFTYAITSTVTTAGVIPANADIVDVMFWVSTLFNDSGTDTISCGYSDDGDPDDYVDAIDAVTAGMNRMGDAADMVIVLGDVGATDVTVLCKYSGQNGDASAGAATLQILYRLD